MKTEFRLRIRDERNGNFLNKKNRRGRGRYRNNRGTRRNKKNEPKQHNDDAPLQPYAGLSYGTQSAPAQPPLETQAALALIPCGNFVAPPNGFAPQVPTQGTRNLVTWFL